MSRTLIVALALAALALGAGAAACGGNDDDSGTLRVVATTSQIAALTREVAGDHVHLTTLIKPGATAHDFEPDPGDVADVEDADLVLRNGIGLDDFLDDIVDTGDAKVVTVTEGIQVQKSAADQGEDDPHVWHDAGNARTMVRNIAAALATADPANAATYQANAASYDTTLAETDREVRDIINSIPPEDRKMVTNHDAFGYFIRRYGLTFVGAIIPSASSDAQPSAGELADLQETIERENVKAIFAEEELDPTVAEQLAKDTGVKIVDDLYADSLAADGEASTIHGMLLWNARRIADGLR